MNNRDEIQVSVGDVVVRGTATGPEDGPPVVLLHGGGQTRHAWSAVAERLASTGCRAIAMDLRGHGDSDWAPDGDYHIDAFARDLMAVVGELGRAPIVVGASLGGMVALVAEGESQIGLSSGLVLVDIAPRMEPAGVDRIVGFMTAHPTGFGSLDEAADAIAAYRPDRPRPDDLRGLAKNLRLGSDGRWHWHWDPGFLASGRGPGSRAAPDRLDVAARQIRVPTLLVRGARSDLLSEEGAQHFLGLVPHSQYIDVAGAGHMVVGDRNDAFSGVIQRFVAEVHDAALVDDGVE